MIRLNPDHPAVIRAYEDLTTAVLHDMLSERGDPTAAHYDDDRDFSQDTVALAARTLYEAVEGLPRDDKPMGWNQKPFEGRLPVMLNRTDLDRLVELVGFHGAGRFAPLLPGTPQPTSAEVARDADLLERLRQERATFDKWGDHVEPFDTDITLPE